MNRSAPYMLWAAGAAALVSPHALAGQRANYDSGILLSPQVSCRAAPSSTAGLAAVLGLTGNASREMVTVRDSAVDEAGATWVSVQQPAPLRQEWCWVPEATVGPAWDPNSLLTMADLLLSSPHGRRLADWVAVYNYFRHPFFREDVEASAALSLRRLDVLIGAMGVVQAEGARDLDPRVVAWLESLGAEIDVVDGRSGRRWVVNRSLLEAIYERHPGSSMAEEVLWRSARYPPQSGECVRSLPCVFQNPLAELASYWLAYPDGRFVREAAWTALGWLRRVGGDGILETCEGARDAESEAMYRLWREWWDGLSWEAEGEPAARRLLETLNEVRQEEKAPLVDYLDRVKRCALDVATRPPPPQQAPRIRGETAAAPETAPTPEARELAIATPGVLCRQEPSWTARGYAVLQLDEHFTTERPDTVAAGEPWVSVRRWGSCWIPKAETAPVDTHDHVLAIANRFLTSGEGRTLDHSLRVYNVLGSPHLGHRDIVDGSALLSLRRLQVLEEVLKTLDAFTADALTRGWIEQLVDDVWYFGPGGAWYVRDEAFQRVYEAHRESPEAENVLWELATGPSPHDCEGRFACTVRVTVLEKFARYWTDYPRGRHVGQAINVAAARLGGFLRSCEAARGAEPDSREARWWQSTHWDPSGAELAAELRATLADVSSSDAEPLTTVLDRLEACAAEVAI